MSTATVVGPTASQTAAKRLSISDCIKGSRGLPPRIVFYGRPGFGKTSVAAFSDHPFFMFSPGETGLHTLMDAGIVPNNIPNIEIPDWDNYMSLIDDLTRKSHGGKTLVVDTINGMEALANIYTKQRDYPGEKGDKEFQSYMSGYRSVTMGCWREMLAALDKLRQQKQMMIILLAHTGTAKVANPSGGDFSKWAPAFTGHWSWDVTYGWADAVLFGEFHVDVTKHKQTDTKGKANSNGQRFIHTGWSPDYDAKGGRLGLPLEIVAPDTAEETWKVLASGFKSTNNSKKEGE